MFKEKEICFSECFDPLIFMLSVPPQTPWPWGSYTRTSGNSSFSLQRIPRGLMVRLLRWERAQNRNVPIQVSSGVETVLYLTTRPNIHSQDISVKTKEVLTNLVALADECEDSKITLEALKQHHFPPATENFLFHLAAAEQLLRI